MGVPTQSTTIASNAVIGIMAPQPLAQVAVLFGDAQMQVMPVTSTEPRRASSLPVPLSAAVSCTGVQVYRLAGFRVPSHVSRQQFSSQVSPFSPAGPIDLVPRLRRYYGDATPSAVYASRTASPLPMQDSLPAGWLAFAEREFNPLDQIERVQLLHLIPLSRVFLTQAGRMSGENLWMR